LKTKNNITIVIKTFSTVLLNFLGHLVANNKIDINDIGIVIYYKNDTIKCMYNKKGYIEDYPIGFLDPNIDYYI